MNKSKVTLKIINKITKKTIEEDEQFSWQNE